jgi:hypothetical protein
MVLEVGLGGRFSPRLDEVNEEGSIVLRLGVEKERHTQVCQVLIMYATIAPGNESLSRCCLLVVGIWFGVFKKFGSSSSTCALAPDFRAPKILVTWLASKAVNQEGTLKWDGK